MRDTKKLDQKILRILVPAILENAFLILSDMILTGYIGRLSVTEISAYGISTRVYGIYFSILKGFAIGTMVIFARAFGAGKRKEGLNYYFQALFIAFPVALVAAVLIWVFPQPLLSTMSSVFHLDIFWIWMIVNADQWVRYLLSAGVIISKKVLRYLDQPHFPFQCEGQVNACK